MSDETVKLTEPKPKAFGRVLLFIAAFLVPFQILIAAPIAIWVRNKFNFEADILSSLSTFALPLLICLVIAGLIAFALPRKLRFVVLPVLAVLNLVILIQQNFLNWNYGILDGDTLDFGRNTGLGFVDLALWLGAIALCVFALGLVRKQVRNIVAGVGLVSILLTLTNLMTVGSANSTYSVDESDKFAFSKTNNTLVFMFDAFQMDMLLKILDENPEFETELDGFTLYENNSAVFAKTYPTVPMFLTGKRYQKEEPIMEFFDSAYENSLMSEMQAKGWNVGLYPDLERFPSLVNAVDIHPRTMDNAVGGTLWTVKSETYLKSLDLSLFRTVPHQLKRLIFNDGEFVTGEAMRQAFGSLGKSEGQNIFVYETGDQHHALAFKNLLKEEGAASIESPAFRFFHFLVPHLPFELDRDLNVVKGQTSFEDFENYSYAGVRLMTDYIGELKRLGVYEDAAIVILSDHGMGRSNNLQYNPETGDYEKINRHGFHRAAAKSILLVKEPKQTGSLKRSQKPVSGIDVAPTIAALSGLSTEGFEGTPVQDLAEDQARERIFNYYTFSTWDSKYLDAFEAYSIQGDVREDASWTKTGLVREAVTFVNSETYELGQILSYGEDVKQDTDFKNAFIIGGDYSSEANFVTASDGKISLSIPLSKPIQSEAVLRLQFEIYSGVAQDRIITVNGSKLSMFATPRRRELNEGILLSPEVHKGADDLEISFSVPEGAEKPKLNLASVKITDDDSGSEKK